MTLLTEPTRIVLAKGQPVPNDPNFAFNSLLLHGDGTNGSTVITDSSGSPKTVTAVGNAQISTAQSKFGGGSIFMDGGTIGADDYLTTPISSAYDFDGDFTLEAWIWKPADGRTSVDTVFSTVSNGASQGLFWEISATAGMRLRINNAYRVTYNYNPNTSSWQHVAAVRASGTIRLFLDGVTVATAAYADPIPSVGYLGNVYIGAISPASGYFFNGYIDDLRITKGIARYTANFSVPTAPFPDF